MNFKKEVYNSVFRNALLSDVHEIPGQIRPSTVWEMSIYYSIDVAQFFYGIH